MDILRIYHTDVRLPEQPPLSQIDGSDLPKKEQKWVRKELPPFFNKVEYDKNGTLLLTNEQEEYAREEVRRCKQGYWFMNNGVPTYITGKNYFYLQWWKLEDDIYPFYRDTDRRYFLFLEYWEKVLWCLGVIRGKKRREGASSQACSNLAYEAIFYKNSNCGLVSKSKDDSRDTFTDMVMFGYRQLPAFLKPKQLSKDDTVSELILAHKSQSDSGDGSVIKDDGAHRSKINYKAPVLNAYDRGRMSRVLIDEGGKYPKEVPTSKLLAIISKTLVKGIKRVGFIEMPSTVNSLTKGSGNEFKICWKYADFLKKKPTTNRLVRYFSPAYDGYEGFIDEYGMSVIDEPTQEQYEYLVNKWVIRDSVTGDLISELSEDDIKLGAKHYVTIKRREGLEGEDLEEEIRMNPCDEDEMFQSAVTDCVFDSVQIMKQRKELEEKPPILRTGKFYRDLQNQNIVKFKDDENGNWQILAMPPDDKKNKYKFVDRKKTPANESDFVIGVDGYSNSQGGRKYGSKCSAFVMDRSNLTYIAMFYGRPETKELLHEQICMAAEYYGCKVWYEFTSDDYKGHFDQRGKINYLGRFPLSVIDPNKRDSTNRYYGFPITPFAMTKQLDSLIAYVAPDKETGYSYCSRIYFDKLLEQMLPFEPDNRTSYDCVVAAMITLCCALEPVETRITKTEPFIKEYFSQSIEKF